MKPKLTILNYLYILRVWFEIIILYNTIKFLLIDNLIFYIYGALKYKFYKFLVDLKKKYNSKYFINYATLNQWWSFEFLIKGI